MCRFRLRVASCICSRVYRPVQVRGIFGQVCPSHSYPVVRAAISPAASSGRHLSLHEEKNLFPLPPIPPLLKSVTLQLPLHVAEQVNSQGNGTQRPVICLTLFTVLTVYLSVHSSNSPWCKATTPRKEYEYQSLVRPDRHHELMSS